MGLTLFLLKYLPFPEPEVNILLPRTVLNICFRPGQVYLFVKCGISPKIWRHHRPEVASSKFQLRRIPSSWVPLDWLTTSQSEHSSVWGGGTQTLVSICLSEKHPNLVVPKLKKYTPFCVTYREKHPFLHHFIPGFCEKYNHFHIFVDFDTLTE